MRKMIIYPKSLYKLGIVAHLDQDKLQDFKNTYKNIYIPLTKEIFTDNYS